MGILSIFKKKNKKDHNDVCEFLNHYNRYQTFLSCNDYISIREMNEFKKTITESLNYIKKLNASGLLEEMCVKTKYDTLKKIH